MMGVLSMFSSSSFENQKPAKPAKPAKLPNPDPRNFKVVEAKQYGKALYLELLYPDCTNYEGRKILVFEAATLAKLRAQAGGIDPHFCGVAGVLSPFARFEPTALGRYAARDLCRKLGGV